MIRRPLALAVALLAAVAGTACCWLPLVLVFAGLSGGWMIAVAESWRAVLIPVAFVSLAAGFYLSYRRPREVAPVESGGNCCRTDRDRSAHTSGSRRLLWVVSVFVAAMTALPYSVELLSQVPSTEIAPADGRRMEIHVDGMTCAACALAIEHALRDVPGVFSAEVDFPSGAAVIKADATTTPESLRSAIETAGYTASPAE